MWNPVKSPGIKSGTTWTIPDLLKPLLDISYISVYRSATERKDLTPYYKSEKSQIYHGDQQGHYSQVFQRLH